MADNKIKTFFNTAKDVVKHAAETGKLRADDVLVSKRREICSKCEHLSNNRCNRCGCFVATKTVFEAASCPLKRW